MAQMKIVMAYDRYIVRIFLVLMAGFGIAAILRGALDSTAGWPGALMAFFPALLIFWALAMPRIRVYVEGDEILIREQRLFKEVVHHFNAREPRPDIGIVEDRVEGYGATLNVHLADGRKIAVASASSLKAIQAKELTLNALWTQNSQDARALG